MGTTVKGLFLFFLIFISILDMAFGLFGLKIRAVFLLFIFTYLSLDLFLDFLMGDSGKYGEIKRHFKKITGKDKPILEDALSLKDELDKENINKYRSIGLGVALVIGFFSYIIFFFSIFISLFLFLFSFIFVPKILKNRNDKKRAKLINIQFRDALNAIMASLKSGLSINRAIMKVPEDLMKIHEIYKEKIILKEFIAMRNDLNMGVTLDEVLISFRERLNSEEADDFVNSVIILKRKGGNLVEVMQNTIAMISDKMALKAEIELITAAKKGEAKVLTAMPVVVVVGMSLIMRNYISPIFEGLWSILPLIAFLMLIANYFIGEKITDIQA
jgi:tight adherence protein B